MHAVNILRKPIAINPRSRLRWSRDRDPVECTCHFYFALVGAAASAAFAVVLHARRRRGRSISRAVKDWSCKIAKDGSGISKTCDGAERSEHAQGVGNATLASYSKRSDSVLICSCIWLTSQLFATRLRWSRVCDQAECNLQKHFSACATATPALTSYVSRLEIA